MCSKSLFSAFDKPFVILALVVIGSLPGCGSTDFMGKSDKGGSNQSGSAGNFRGASSTSNGTKGNPEGDPSGSNIPGVNPSNGPSGDPGNCTAQASANGTAAASIACDPEGAKLSSGIQKCLNTWGGKAPFTMNSPYRKIAASVTVLGVGNAINDTTTTTTPELVVLVAGVNVLSSPRYRLLNPNGWYCFVADVNVLSGLTVDLHKTAHLADSRVNVGVLSSSTDQTAMVDVNVLSDVKVNRVDQ